MAKVACGDVQVCGNNHAFVCWTRCRAREALRQCLPDQLKDQTFATCLKDDNSTKRWLSQLLKNLDTPGLSPGPGGMTLPAQWAVVLTLVNWHLAVVISYCAYTELKCTITYCIAVSAVLNCIDGRSFLRECWAKALRLIHRGNTNSLNFRWGNTNSLNSRLYSTILSRLLHYRKEN
jgi:Cell differentiation family, Rcd1-like